MVEKDVVVEKLHLHTVNGSDLEEVKTRSIAKALGMEEGRAMEEVAIPELIQEEDAQWERRNGLGAPEVWDTTL